MMMKYFVLITFILLLNKSYCQLSVDKDFIDFGIVTDTTDNWRGLKITNTSATETITIQNIVIHEPRSAFRLSCPESLTCADNYYPIYKTISFELLPGKSVEISVACYKAFSITKPTHVSQQLVVRYQLNDHRNAGTLTQKVALLAFITPPVTFSTDTIHLGTVNQGDSLTGTYYLLSNYNRVLHWKVYTEPGCRVSLPYPNSVQPHSIDSLVFKLKTDSLCDHVTGVITIQYEDSKPPEYYYLFYEVTITNVKNYAAAEFESEKIYRKMPVNGDGIYVFHFKNTGTIPYIIANCKSSCGCLAPRCSYEPVMPGKSGVIEAHYDTSRLGEFLKVLTVVSNDRYVPIRVLQVSGHVGD